MRNQSRKLSRVPAPPDTYVYLCPSLGNADVGVCSAYYMPQEAAQGAVVDLLANYWNDLGRRLITLWNL